MIIVIRVDALVKQSRRNARQHRRLDALASRRPNGHSAREAHDLNRMYRPKGFLVCCRSAN